MTKPKKLIEVAMPVKEISAESVRDKSIRHGHISTLHLWWARRPLPVCRAVVFASLVPDPLDENCPEQFKEAIELLLGKDNDLPGDPYKPYEDIPHTAVVDKMEDNLRNRLMMFIGKFSDKYVSNEKLGKKTTAKDQIHPFSLIKWENKNEEKIIGRARKLIFVSHNAGSSKSARELLLEYETLNRAIKNAESDLYSYPNRHIQTEGLNQLEKNKNDALSAFLVKMPKVFDPFAGGGAIPLEASRLGCNSFGNDINPVAHIIQKGSCEFPHKFGKPINFSKSEYLKIYGEEQLNKNRLLGNILGDNINISNRLAHDVEFFCSQVYEKARKKFACLYEEKDEKYEILTYHWARVASCENRSCSAKVPMISNFYLSKKRSADSKNYVFLDPEIHDDEINLSIKKGLTNRIGWISRGNITCPVCKNITDKSQVKKQFIKGEIEERLLAILIKDKKTGSRRYIEPELKHIEHFNKIKEIDQSELSGQIQPCSAGGDTIGWGVTQWIQLFNKRQITVLSGIREIIIKTSETIYRNFEHKYAESIITYLSIYFNRILLRNSSYGKWHLQQETAEHLYGRQSIQMSFDYPEVNVFSSFTNGAYNQIKAIIDVVNEESKIPFSSEIINAASGDIKQFPSKYIDSTVTDPPYYDAIAYADISDFFYSWLKKILLPYYTLNFSTPSTPKKEECTALKHHHQNSRQQAELHFENKLKEIFQVIQTQTREVISIMFAHQSTKAWTTLCNSILGANMNINSSWAIDTENTGALKVGKRYLASSVTVTCKPIEKSTVGDYKDVQNEINRIIKEEVKLLYNLGFRGADLLTACFGQAVSVFGQYESVEKADGSEVTVAELLEMAREAAFDAIISDIETDDLTKFYIGWLNLFGFSEAVHDDVRRISQIGLSVDISEIYGNNVLVKEGDKGTLGDMKSRLELNPRAGLKPVHNSDIDIAHRLMYLYDPKNGSRKELLDYIANKAPNSESTVWRVLNSLLELLPKSKDFNDRELAQGLLSNQENLIREAKNRKESSGVQGSLDFE